MGVIDPQTWADAEDGRALRELREALPEGWSGPAIYPKPLNAGWHAEAFDDRMDSLDGRHGEGHTIAEAADACRAALRG
jgi:hypothetical protein